MSVLEIPSGSEFPDYTERVELDGEVYQLRFRWNTRAECWFLDIADDAGAPLVYGRRLSVDAAIIHQVRHRVGMMPGELLPFDTTPRQLDATIEDLGTRVVVLYLDAAEVSAL